MLDKDYWQTSCNDLIGVKYDGTDENIAREYTQSQSEGSATEMWVYVVTACQANNIVFAGKAISREGAGVMIVCIDLIIMASMLVGIRLIDYFIRIDVLKHKRHLFEVSEFALEFWNLPPIHDEYSIHLLKAELTKHI